MSLRTTLATRILFTILLLATGTGTCVAEKILPDYCEAEFDSGEHFFVQLGEILEKEHLPALTTVVKQNKDFLLTFMKYYQQDIPTLVITPPDDYRTMSLEELERAIKKPLPHDIYTGRPFIYNTSKNSFNLYSTGNNGIDNKMLREYEGRGFFQDLILYSPNRQKRIK